MSDHLGGYITWGDLDQVWGGGSGLTTEPSLDLLSDVIAPAINPISAANPVVKAMYDTLPQLGTVAAAAHAHGNLVTLDLYTDSSGQFGPTLAQIVSAGTLNILANSIRDVLNTYNFDGVTVDCEDSDQTPAILDSVIKAFYAVLNPLGKYIDLTGRPYTSPNIALGSAQYLRLIHVMCYDMGWGRTPNGWPQSSIADSEAGMLMWSNAGFPKNKLIMGIPIYGRTAYDTTLNPYQESLLYRQIVAQNPNAYNLDYATLVATSGLSRPFWWGSAATDRTKARWAIENGYAGVFVFALGYDTLNTPNSLLLAIHSEMYGDPNLIAASDSPPDWMARAGKICDGVSDQVEINAQIAAAVAVVLAPGHFNTDNYVLPKSGSRLGGQGSLTIVNLNGFGVLPFDVSDVVVGNFDVTGASKDFALAVSANQANVNNVLFHDINCRALGCMHFLAYAGSNRKVSNVSFVRCLGDSPDGAAFTVSGEGTSPIIEDVTFFLCKARYCGIAPTRLLASDGTAWENGFDLVEYNGATYRRITAIACESDYSWEDAYHLEYVPVKQDIVLLDNYAAHGGQKPAPLYGCGYLIPLAAAHPDNVAFFGQTGMANTLGDVRIFNEATQNYDTHSLPDDFTLPTALPVVRINQGNCTGIAINQGTLAKFVLYSTDGNPVDQQIDVGFAQIHAQFTDFLVESVPASLPPNTFLHGSQHTATVPVKGTPPSLPMQAEAWLGPDTSTKVATSGQVAFTSTGANQNIACPVTMPATPGTYQAYVDIFVNGAFFSRSVQSPVTVS